jgi:hypothetical protein
MDAPTDATMPRPGPASIPPASSKDSTLRRFVKDPLSVTLILVIVLAL